MVDNAGDSIVSEVLVANPFCFMPNSAQDPHCLKEDDTTEHLLLCSALGPSLFTVSEIANEENVQLWKQMVERINTNMKWREGR